MIEHHVATLPDPRADVRDHMQRLASEAADYEACKTGNGTPCLALALARSQRDAARKAAVSHQGLIVWAAIGGYAIGFATAAMILVWLL